MKLNTEAFKRRMQESSASLILLGVIIVAMVFLDRRFFSATNIINILRIGAITVIAVYGQTLVLLTGQIDLSMGSMASLVSVIIGICLTWYNLPLAVSLIIGLICGILLGLVNGVLVFYFNLPSFIITFGMLTSLSGLARYLTTSTPIELVGVCNFEIFGRGFIGPIPIPIIIAVAAFLILRMIVLYTTYGRTLYAIGYNRNVARLSGRKVVSIGITTYAFAGLLTAITAIIMSSRIYCAHPDLASDLAFDAIAAAAIGGVSLQGGKGNLLQATVGALIVVALLNGLTLLNVSTYMQMVTRGLIIIFAVMLNNVRTEGFTNLTGISLRKQKVGV